MKITTVNQIKISPSKQSEIYRDIEVALINPEKKMKLNKNSFQKNSYDTNSSLRLQKVMIEALIDQEGSIELEIANILEPVQRKKMVLSTSVKESPNLQES